MAEPTQIPISSLPAENSSAVEQSNSSPATAQTTSTEPKLSISEFENYQPSGIKPEVKDVSTIKQPPTTTTIKDTNEAVDKETEKEVEGEIKGEGEVKEGTEGDEEEKVEGEEKEEFSAHDYKDGKVHGNSKKDLTGFSPEEVAILKRLDNPRFEKISTHWKALKQAAAKSIELVTELESAKKLLKEGGIPQSWHEHPEAYQLSKEFQDINTQYSQQDQLENHYEQQLLNIRQGKQWTYVTGIDPKTNALLFSPPQEASDKGDFFAMKQMTAATNSKGQLDGKAAALRDGFKQNYEKASGTIKAEVDYVVSKMHPDLKPVEADVNTVIQALPKQYSGHPLAYGYGQLGAIIMAQGRKLAKLMGEQNNNQRLKQDIAKAGPTSPTKARPSAPAKPNGLLSMKDFGVD